MYFQSRCLQGCLPLIYLFYQSLCICCCLATFDTVSTFCPCVMLVLSTLYSCWVPWNCLAAWSWWNCWSASSVVRRVSMSMKMPYKMPWLPSQNGEWWLGEVKDKQVSEGPVQATLAAFTKRWVVTWWGERQTGQWRSSTGHPGCLLNGEWWLGEVKDKQVSEGPVQATLAAF